MFYNMHFIFHSLRHIIYTFIATNKMKQENQYAFLQFIDPPPNYPPSEYEICTQIQSKFYSECMHFLKSQKKLYECSKKIEKRLNNSLADSTSLDQWIKINENKLEKITKQLRKINCHYVDAEQKQQFLGSICKFINMEQAKKILLSNKINDEDQFMEKIRQIAFLAEEIKDLKSDAKVIVQIKQQMSSLLQETVNKLIKGSISDNFLKRITSDVSEPFLKDPKVSSIFIKNLIHQRLNFFRVGLNPLINNLNYVQNVTELYQKIVEEWLKMLQCQSEIFCRPEVPQQLKIISREVLIKLSPQVLPKMERGIYKVKSLIDLSKMRCSFLKLKSKLEQYGQGSWEGLAKIILKVSILIEQKLQEEAEQIEIAKYNIYSLVSYVPIRQHLQIIKEAKIYDPNNGQMNWERGFKKLADSRDPSKQPNNKSLIIFNLNIWFLYSHIMKEEGQLIKRAEEMTKQCSNLIVNVNSQQMKKQYEAKSLQKLIDICADYQNIKKNLFSEINLLHHERLRSSVERVLRSKFIQQIYVPILKQNNIENGLNNAQTVELAKKQKINLNKYGKLSENLRIFTSEEMKSLLA